jgi:hypothetical protein
MEFKPNGHSVDQLRRASYALRSLAPQGFHCEH